jgi:dTDP-4-dehydrorhamnose reductase
VSLRVAITGARGMLGQDVVRACLGRDHEVFALGREELDVTDPDHCEGAIAEIGPEVVINCAAWTDVDGAEADEAGAKAVNDTGAAQLAAACERHGARILHVSSDYVFDGSKRRPYVESDLPEAISAYGRSKQAGETSVAVSNPRHIIVRSAWLFGARGHNFVETMLRLCREQPEVVVVSDQVGCPTYTGHLAPALAALAESEAYGIHHVAASGSCSWFEFAQEIFDQAGSECRVMATTTDMIGRPAPRPAYSVLASERPDAPVLPDWRQGLREYLVERERVRVQA